MNNKFQIFEYAFSTHFTISPKCTCFRTINYR